MTPVAGLKDWELLHKSDVQVHIPVSFLQSTSMPLGPQLLEVSDGEPWCKNFTASDSSLIREKISQVKNTFYEGFEAGVWTGYGVTVDSLFRDFIPDTNVALKSRYWNIFGFFMPATDNIIYLLHVHTISQTECKY